MDADGQLGVGVIQDDGDAGAGQALLVVHRAAADPLDTGHVVLAADVAGHGIDTAVDVFVLSSLAPAAQVIPAKVLHRELNHTLVLNLSLNLSLCCTGHGWHVAVNSSHIVNQRNGLSCTSQIIESLSLHQENVGITHQRNVHVGMLL